MWENDETGVLFPVKEFAEICQSWGVLYHCDAVQAAGKVEIDVRKIPADYISLTGHKFHAPKGIGALYVQRKSPFSPMVCGGHQERNWRGGTENVPLIVGLGKAAQLARKHLPAENSHSSAATKISEKVPCFRFHTLPRDRCPLLPIQGAPRRSLAGQPSKSKISP